MQDRRAYICYTRADKAAAAKMRRALARLSQSASAASSDQNLAIGPILAGRVTDAPLSKTARFDIEASDHLILFCSAAALTPAMDEAVMIFKAKGRAHRIIPVLTDGEPWASRTPGLEHRECLPRALRFAPDASGALTGHPVTPPSVDLRPDGLPMASAAAHLAARITGAPVATFHRISQTGHRRRGYIAGAIAAAAMVALTLAPVVWKDMETRAKVDTARMAGLAAHQALDDGQRLAAINALTGVFPREFDFAEPPYPVPNEALSALSRAALETRELSDLAAPLQDIIGFEASPDGALIALGANAQAYLVDVGAGEALPIYEAGDNATSRVSPDGATLWTARFGAETQNGDGDSYAPLIFEDVDLASGATSLSTAVQSLPPQSGATQSGATAISPDGAHFAVDLGPGHVDQTLVAVFDRRGQVLAGVTSLPADRVNVQFLAPGRLLLSTNPPNVFGAAPGLYLWNLGEEAPLVLRAPGRMPLCPGVGGAPRRVIAAELKAGRLPAADWAVSDDGAEISLLLPSIAGGSCILRWDARTGQEKPPLKTDTQYQSLAFTVAGGPYAVLPNNDDLRLISHRGETPLTGCQGPVHHFAGGGDPVTLCEGALESDGATTLHHGYSGQRIWRGPALPVLTAVSYDSLSQHLIMARADGRITIWDAAERGYQIARTSAHVTLAQADADHIAVISPAGAPSFFDPLGRLTMSVDPALIARVQPGNAPQLLALNATALNIIDAPGPAETCAALVGPEVIHCSDSPSGARTAIETEAGLAVYDRATCLPLVRFATRTVGSGPLLVSEDLLWAPLPGEVAVFPLTVPAAEALESLHARAARVGALGE